MRLFKPTRVRKCWLAFDGTYSGYGPTAEDAIEDMEWWCDRHLRGMANEEKKKDSIKIKDNK